MALDSIFHGISITLSFLANFHYIVEENAYCSISRVRSVYLSIMNGCDINQFQEKNLIYRYEK